jgi:hypothetical protein
VKLSSIEASSWALKFSELHDHIVIKYSTHPFDNIDIFYVRCRLANLINCHSCQSHVQKKSFRYFKRTPWDTSLIDKVIVILLAKKLILRNLRFCFHLCKNLLNYPKTETKKFTPHTFALFLYLSFKTFPFIHFQFFDVSRLICVVIFTHFLHIPCGLHTLPILACGMRKHNMN